MGPSIQDGPEKKTNSIAIYTKIKDKMKLFHHSVQEVQDVVVVVVVADF